MDHGEDLTPAFGGNDQGTTSGEDDPIALGPPAQQVDPDQLGHVLRARACADFCRRPDLHHPAGLEDDEAVGQRGRLEGVVGHEQPGTGEGCQVPADLPAELHLRAGVEGGGRLVQQQQARIGRQRSSQRHPLRLTTREGPGTGRHVGGEAHPLQPFPGTVPGLTARHPPAAQAEGDVLQGAHVGEQQVVLEHEAHGTPFGWDPELPRRVLQHLVVKDDPAPGQGDETGEGPHHGGLPRAIGANDGHDLAVGDSDLRVEIEGSEPELDVGVEAHRSTGPTSWGTSGP